MARFFVLITFFHLLCFANAQNDTTVYLTLVKINHDHFMLTSALELYPHGRVRYRPLHDMIYKSAYYGKYNWNGDTLYVTLYSDMDSLNHDLELVTKMDSEVRYYRKGKKIYFIKENGKLAKRDYDKYWGRSLFGRKVITEEADNDYWNNPFYWQGTTFQ